MNKYICKGCKIEFIPYNPRQKFHNIECRIRFYAPIKYGNSVIFKTLFSSTKRRCLSCYKIFNSEGNWNRICGYCKRTLAFESAVMNY